MTPNPQPYCRCCGKAIKKKVVTHYFGAGEHMAGKGNSFSFHHGEPATTKAEAQRHVNGQIVSIRRGYGGNVVAGVWDGESYIARDFCTEGCAASFGRMAAALYPTLDTQAAYDARKARQ